MYHSLVWDCRQESHLEHFVLFNHYFLQRFLIISNKIVTKYFCIIQTEISLRIPLNSTPWISPKIPSDFFRKLFELFPIGALLLFFQSLLQRCLLEINMFLFRNYLRLFKIVTSNATWLSPNVTLDYLPKDSVKNILLSWRNLIGFPW